MLVDLAADIDVGRSEIARHEHQLAAVQRILAGDRDAHVADTLDVFGILNDEHVSPEQQRKDQRRDLQRQILGKQIFEKPAERGENLLPFRHVTPPPPSSCGSTGT